MEVDRAKGRGSLTRSVKLAQRVRYDNRPVGHYLTSDRRSLKNQAGTVPDQALDAWTKSVGDRITRDASTAKVDQVFGSDFDHLPL